MLEFLFILLFVHRGFTQTFFHENNSTNNDYMTVPGAPHSIQIENISDSSAHVSWTLSEYKTDIIQYEVSANIIHTYSNQSFYSRKWTFSNNTFRSQIGLHPGTKYNISIVAVSKNGPGVAKFQIIETDIAEPDQEPPKPEVLKREGTTMVVKLFPTYNNNGPITFYRIIIMNIDQMQVFQQEWLESYEQAATDGFSYYITADVIPQDDPQEFVVGDRNRYNGYYNGPLEKDYRYHAFVGVVSKLNGLTKIRYPTIDRRLLQNVSSESESSGLVVGLAIAVALASMLLVIGIVILLLVRRRFYQNRRQRLSDNQELSVQGPMIQLANHGYIPDEDLEQINHYDVLKQTVWNIPPDCLQVNASACGDSFLGFGKFGHVVKGTVQKPSEKSSIPVACYIISDGDLTPDSKRLMLRQLDVLIRSGKHENITSLVGTLENLESVFVVLDYSPLVLKDMLLNYRQMSQSIDKFTSMTEMEMLDILIGIANGMNHLSEKHLIHERLCARNVLMFNGRIPKISGHGLSDYNRENAAYDLTRWKAQEILNRKQFSVKSDVWSFGCLMWEACSLGGTPYSHLDNKRLSYEVCKGVRLPKLPYIGEEFYQLMISCWLCDPDERPTFHEISQQFNYYKNTLSMYSHINFTLTRDFAFEPYVPTMEIAEETFSQRTFHK